MEIINIIFVKNKVKFYYYNLDDLVKQMNYEIVRGLCIDVFACDYAYFEDNYYGEDIADKDKV